MLLFSGHIQLITFSSETAVDNCKISPFVKIRALVVFVCYMHINFFCNLQCLEVCKTECPIFCKEVYDSNEVFREFIKLMARHCLLQCINFKPSASYNNIRRDLLDMHAFAVAKYIVMTIKTVSIFNLMH